VAFQPSDDPQVFDELKSDMQNKWIGQAISFNGHRLSKPISIHGPGCGFTVPCNPKVFLSRQYVPPKHAEVFFCGRQS